MTPDACPRCGLAYERCECPATKGAAAERITGRVLWRVACRMQRKGVPFATGATRPDIERYVDTGRVTHGGIDGYTIDWPQAERSAWQKRRDARVRRGHITEDRDGH